MDDILVSAIAEIAVGHEQLLERHFGSITERQELPSLPDTPYRCCCSFADGPGMVIGVHKDRRGGKLTGFHKLVPKSKPASGQALER